MILATISAGVIATIVIIVVILLVFGILLTDGSDWNWFD